MAPTLLSIPREIRESIWYYFLLSCYKDNIEKGNINCLTPQNKHIVSSINFLTISLLDESHYSECQRDDPTILLFRTSRQIYAEARYVLLNLVRFFLNTQKESKEICNVLNRMSSEDQKLVRKIELITDIEPVKIAWTDQCAFVMAQLPDLRSVILAVIIREPFFDRTNLVKRVMRLATRFKTMKQLMVRLVGEDLLPLDKENTTADLTTFQEEVTARIASGDWEPSEQSSNT